MESLQYRWAKWDVSDGHCISHSFHTKCNGYRKVGTPELEGIEDFNQKQERQESGGEWDDFKRTKRIKAGRMVSRGRAIAEHGRMC